MWPSAVQFEAVLLGVAVAYPYLVLNICRRPPVPEPNVATGMMNTNNYKLISCQQKKKRIQ
jgi:hypothetical protein